MAGPKSPLSAVELKAIGWWSKKYNLTPQLSAYPTYYFKHRETKEPSEEHINRITIEYKAAKKEEAKEAARAKKQEMQTMQSRNARIPNNSESLR